MPRALFPATLPFEVRSSLFLLCAGAACKPTAPSIPRSSDELPEGFWFDTRFDQGSASLPLDLRSQLQRLGEIGYADGYEPLVIDTGVIDHDTTRAEPGWNLYSSGHAPEALLMDMQGQVHHRWAFHYEDLPGAVAMEHPSQNAWRRVELLEAGGLLAIHEGLGLLRLDRDSQLHWYWPGNAHHDLALTDESRILVLARRPTLQTRWNKKSALLEDFVVELDMDGNELRRVSIYEALDRSPYVSLLNRAVATGGDALHTNSLEFVQQPLADRLPSVHPGQVLLCLRELPAICTLDLDREQITWLIQGPWGRPHAPSQTPSGELLLFDNMGNQGFSRLLQLQPSNGEVTWRFAGDPPQSFFSILCGAARRLPGGNTLVSLSCAGRSIELSPEGDIVWSFNSPHRAGPEDELVAALFEVRRMPLEATQGWLK